MIYSMKAWAKSIDEKKSSGIRFLGDADGSFARAMDVEFDATGLLGNKRSKRFAALTEDGKITKIFVEPDNTGITGELEKHHVWENELMRLQALLPTRCSSDYLEKASSESNIDDTQRAFVRMAEKGEFEIPKAAASILVKP